MATRTRQKSPSPYTSSPAPATSSGTMTLDHPPPATLLHRPESISALAFHPQYSAYSLGSTYMHMAAVRGGSGAAMHAGIVMGGEAEKLVDSDLDFFARDYAEWIWRDGAT
ncbi:hypothetical protein RUND412_001906 [Rhizina undulata]